MTTQNNSITYANFPQSFDEGVLLREVLGVDAVASKVFYVGNNPAPMLYNELQASDSNRGTFLAPFSTLTWAISQCTAGANNVIFVREGYAQTITAAGGITCNVAGTYIVGIGQGANRPTLTFSTATTASVLVSAANVTFKNFIGVSAINALTNPFNIQAAGCTLDIEWQDASTILEANRAVLTSAAASNFKLKLRYLGQTGGSSCVNAVRLVGAADATINMFFNGKASTSIVEFATTACTDVTIGGYFYNSGTTNASKNVVDTITGSTWYVLGSDGAAGKTFEGGSGNAIGFNDSTVVIADLAVPAANASTNTLERDVIGNKTDTGVTAVGSTASLMAYTQGLVTMNTVQSANSTNNAFAGDVIGNKTDTAATTVGTTTSMVAYNKGNLNQTLKLDGAAVATNYTTGSIADFMDKNITRASNTLPQSGAGNIFLVTGGPIEIISLIGEVTTVVQTQANASKLQITDTASSTTTDICSTTSITAAAVGTFFNITGTLATALVVTAGGTAIGQATPVVAPVGAIKFNCAASNTGAVKWHLRWRPIGAGAQVAAA